MVRIRVRVRVMVMVMVMVRVVVRVRVRTRGQARRVHGLAAEAATDRGSRQPWRQRPRAAHLNMVKRGEIGGFAGG